MFRLAQKFKLGTWVTVAEDRRRAIGKNISGTPALISAISNEDGATLLYPNLLGHGPRYFRKEGVPFSKLRPHAGAVHAVEKKLIQALQEERKLQAEKKATSAGEVQVQLTQLASSSSPASCEEEPERQQAKRKRAPEAQPQTPLKCSRLGTPEEEEKVVMTPQTHSRPSAPKITPEKTPRPTPPAAWERPCMQANEKAAVAAIAKAFRSAGASVLTLPEIDKAVTDLGIELLPTHELLQRLESKNKVMVQDDLCFLV